MGVVTICWGLSNFIFSHTWVVSAKKKRYNCLVEIGLNNSAQPKVNKVFQAITSFQFSMAKTSQYHRKIISTKI